MRISVITPTYNRLPRLTRVLGALERQTAPVGTFEVIVVDDGSTDGTKEWLASHRPPFDLRPVSQANGGPARARNAGLAAARGDLVVFLDDDVEPTPELIAEHARSHELEADVVVMGPLGSLPHYEQPWVAWEQAKVEEQYSAMSRKLWEPTFRQFWTGNVSLVRDQMQRAGGFNPTLLRAEDIDLGFRLQEQGLRFRFNPRARGLHYAERSLESWEHMHRSYGRIEVEIFGSIGDADLMKLLAEKWNQLSPAVRRLVTHAVSHPTSHSLLTGALRRAVHSELAKQTPVLTSKACSALATLIYWQASVEALGSARAERLWRHAASVRGAE